MTNKKIKKQKGIALIITIMLSAIMLTSVFVASREMLDEAKNSTRIDNSLIAYYAAEAGLEDALLQYRFDKNFEIKPDKCVNLDDDNNVDPAICNDTWSPASLSKRFYKVNMQYKTNSFGSETKPIFLNKDDVLELSLPDATSSINLSWTDVDGYYFGGNRLMADIKIYNKNGDIVNKNLNDTKSFNYTNNTSSPEIVRIRPWLLIERLVEPAVFLPDGRRKVDAILGGSIRAEDSPKIKISGISGLNFGGPITKIESVGYYGGVQRKITANVDRSSGQVLSIMDFVIYSGSNLIK